MLNYVSDLTAFFAGPNQEIAVVKVIGQLVETH